MTLLIEGWSVDGDEQRRSAVVDGLRAFAAADAELGREFARSRLMHASDAAAIVEILTAETHGQVLTPARLAKRIGLTAGATSTLLNRLESAGHVVRTRDHPDRRIVGLHSTALIHDDAESFFAPIAIAINAVLARYTAEQLDTFAEMIAKINATTSLTHQAHPGGTGREKERQTRR